MQTIESKDISNISSELAKYPSETTKQAILLEYALNRGIKPSPFKTKSEINNLKKHRRDIYDKLILKYPELFEVANAR